MPTASWRRWWTRSPPVHATGAPTASRTPGGRPSRPWIDREPGPENIRFPLLLTIEFGRHLEPERLAAFVHAHRADHGRRLAHYEAMQHAAPADQAEPYALATLHFGIAYERAALAWFDEPPAAIRGPGAWRDTGERR